MKTLFLNYTKKKISKAKVLKLVSSLGIEFASNRIYKKKLSRTEGIEDISVVFVNKAKSKWVNNKFRKKNYATDVLSFAVKEDHMGLGELVLCEPVLTHQAKEHGLSFQRELDLMIIHGFLHLLGYDHEKSLKDHRQMMKIQSELLKKLSK